MILKIQSLFKLIKQEKKIIINITSYSFFVLSNIILLLLIPENQSKNFFLHYSVANGIFSYIVVLIFSKNIQFDIKYFIIIIITLLITANYLSIFNLLIWIYTLVVIFSDYFFSQKKYIKTNLFIKFFLFASSFLLLVEEIHISMVLNIKIFFLVSIILLFYLKKIHDSFSLKVKHPNLYVMSTCLIYFGSLYLIAYFSLIEFLKIFYISFQIFLSLKLKIFDLNIRGIIKFHKVDKIMFLIGLFYFIFFSIYTNIYFIILLFMISYLLLNYVEKKFIKI